MTIHMHNNYNSEVDNGTGPTTGLELAVNIVERTVSLSKRLIDPTDLIYADQEGSYQPLGNGNVLLGHGAIPKIKMYDANGEAVYTARFGYDASATSYRTFSLEGWHGRPTTKPKVAIERSENGTVVYASWNGATDYDDWVVYAGSSWSDFAMQKMVARQGFETAIRLQENLADVQVKALLGHGTIGESDVLEC